MKWLYRAGMAIAVVGGSIVTGGLLAPAWAGVFIAIGTASGFFHDSPAQVKTL